METKNISLFFTEKFNSTPRLYRSPGRINLIGEHTDYNEGFVLPAAIDKEIIAAIELNNTENECNLYALDLDESYSFDIDKMKPEKGLWANYIMGVVDEFLKLGKKVRGFDCVISGDIPLGSGLSSSAALECVIAFALNDIFDNNLSKIDMIKTAQYAEHNYAGVNCGIMDQFISMQGKKNSVMKLDCRSLEFEYFPLELGDYEILLINSNVKHSHASNEYNTRRQECENGVSILKGFYPEINSLRDVTIQMLTSKQEHFDDITYKRCKYVIEENNRVDKTCDALQEGNLSLVGQLLYQSHAGLSKDYEVSCEEMDFIVDQTKDKDYILGARMMGGGFGGCVINIIKKSESPQFIKSLNEDYKNKYGKEISPINVTISDGSSNI
ncbi:MAG: galactokinase [Saprospiraceae bacterium]